MSGANPSSKLCFKPVYDGARVQKRGYRKAEVWDDHKDFITDLWRNKVKQESILEALESQRGFKAKSNQLKRQLQIWGLSKRNIRARQRKWMVMIKEQREALGKDTRFFFGDTGLDIPEQQIAGVWKAGLTDIPVNEPGSPGELRIETPPPELNDKDRDHEVTGVENRRTPAADNTDATIEGETPSRMDLDGGEVGMIASADPWNDNIFVDENPAISRFEAEGNSSPEHQVNSPLSGTGSSIQIANEANREKEATDTAKSTSAGAETPSPLVISALEPDVEIIHRQEVDSILDDVITSSSLDLTLPSAEDIPNDESSVNFAEIYQKVLKTLESLQLSADTSITNQTGASPVSGIFEAKGDWPGPNSNEYTDDLGEWMEEEFDDALAHIESVPEMMASTGLSFSACRDIVAATWIQDYDEDPLPYHICEAIVQGRPVTPVVSGREDLDDYFGSGPQIEVPDSDISVIQRNVWIPTTADHILTESEWQRIDMLHDKHYPAMRKKIRRIEKSNKWDSAVNNFRQSGAHLQFLRHTFGEFSYFTVVALGTFAYACYTILIINDDDTIFILECALKAYSIIGLKWQEKALGIYIPLAHLSEKKGNILAALDYSKYVYGVSEFRWGPESAPCAAQVPELARLYFRLKRIEEGDQVLKTGLKNIQTAVSKKMLFQSGSDAHLYLKALSDIARIYKNMNGHKIGNVVAKWVIHEFQQYRTTYIGDDVSEFGQIPESIGRAYLMIKDFGNAARMYQWAFEAQAMYYGEQDKRAVKCIRKMCRAMRKRGLVIYTVPILEKMWEIATREDEGQELESQGSGFEAWRAYSKAVVRATGHMGELRTIKDSLHN